MPVTSVHVEGLRELDKALGELTKASAKGVVRRVLLKAAQPIADMARSLAPDDPDTPDPDLESSIGVGTKLSPRQGRLEKKETKHFSQVYAGAGPLPYAHLIEFGSINNSPKPFMRPAWDAQQGVALDIIKRDLGTEIMKTAERAAKRKAAKAARG